MTNAVATSLRIRDVAQLAIDVQDAVNASGALHTLEHDVMPVITNEMRRRAKGTEWRNAHPVLKMFLFKLVDLTGTNTDSSAYAEAYRLCRKMAAGQEECY